MEYSTSDHTAMEVMFSKKIFLFFDRKYSSKKKFRARKKIFNVVVGLDAEWLKIEFLSKYPRFKIM